MNRGIWLKACYESWLAIALFSLGTLVFETILWAVLPLFHEQLSGQLMQVPFLRSLVQAMVGVDLGEEIGPMVVGTLAWTHPVILSLVWAHEIVFCTRLPVGEIDRGTVDTLLGLPVSRWTAFRTESVMWLLSGAIVIGAGGIGSWIGTGLAPAEYTPELPRVLGVIANLYCLYIAIGGIGYLVSAGSHRRGRAVGGVFAIVIVSFFWHVLAQFWSVAKTLSFLGFMDYYRPYDVLRTGEWPLGNMAVLLLIGGVTWFAAGWKFARRDVCTV